MNSLSMHHVTGIGFEPVEHLGAYSDGQDSYYVRLVIIQTTPHSNIRVKTEIVMHSDKPLRLSIPD